MRQLMHTYKRCLWQTAARSTRCHMKAAIPQSLASYPAVFALSGMLRKCSQAGKGRYETVLEPSGASIDSATWCPTEGQEGPITKAELKQAFARGQVGLSTPFWAPGMPEPQPLASIRELRWLVSHRLGTSSSWSCCVLSGIFKMGFGIAA